MLAVLWGCQQKDLLTPPEIQPESISIEPSSATLEIDDEIQLEIVVEPSDAKMPSVTWKALSDYVTVDQDGLVTAVSAGSARVRATTSDGKLSATCTIKVIEPVVPSVPVTGVSLDISQKDMKVGETFTLTATVTPENADVKDVNWTSSNNGVAKVTEGVVEAVGAGTATITVTTVDGKKTATCTVTVTKNEQGGGGDDTGDDDDEPRVRWADTGATVPEYPSYNKVSDVADFPRVDITVSGGITSKTTYKSGTVRFRDPKNMYSKVSDTGDLSGQFRGRGNSTWNLNDQGVRKNPYRIKLTESSKVFGMGKDKDWLLLSELMDPTLLRNAIAQRAARVISMDFAPRFRAVELYINGEYQGCYTLMEHKETGLGHKVFVTPVDPASSETDGGYFFELDSKEQEDLHFMSSTFNRQFNFKDPEQPSQAQQNFVKKLVNDTESAMKSKDWTKVHSLIEMDTWIQNYIIQELSMNVDGNMRLSTYFAKDKDTKLYMPMVWDFDLAFGNAGYIRNYIGYEGPEGWWVKICGGSERDSGHPSDHSGHQTYYQYLFQDSAFVSRLKELWSLYYPRLQNICKDGGYVDMMVQYNAPAFDHNVSAGKNGRVRNWNVDNDTFFYTWEDAVKYVKNFYNTRLEWLNTNINNL